ncbi:glucan endo-1,3-beta-glucosidase 9 isoform X1 [Cucumis melo]|uniref:glucan endo-1,3-beta-D-glucosidase n=1 Tax=Cucumis melo TaxID=3656 RepID=A0A1S3CK47_CUCME|nr:glucan endo-1,3-beta-glucosidase 9 isoform X1 [Cucumis melo]
MPPNLSLILFFFFLNLSALTFSTVSAVGFNWGTAASHPLSPFKVVQLLNSNNITKVKLLDPNPLVLQALSGSTVQLTIGIPNPMLKLLNSSRKAAESWVHDNVTRYLSGGTGGVRIEYIAVGDEPFLQSYGDEYYPYVMGAVANIQAAITKVNLESRIKVVVPCSYDAFLSESGLPSKGHFRPELNKTMIQLLTFLTTHRSPFFASISPFLSFLQNKNISLDFALFKETARPHDDSRRTYKNSFELIYDTLVASLSKIGFLTVDIVVDQVGWPTDGAGNANSSTAETFMKGLLDYLHSRSGSPLRPRRPPLETYILSLLDEDQRNISTGPFERHWGVFTFDGQAKYHLNFGQGTKNLVNAQNVEYLSPKWCVLNNNKDLSNASASALEACSVADCTALAPGASCSNIGWPGNISYAFNSYYQQNDQRPESCDFQGLALITTIDPSNNYCRFPVQIRTSNSQSLDASFLLKAISLSAVFWLSQIVYFQ